MSNLASRVRERPEDYSVRTRNDVAAQVEQRTSEPVTLRNAAQGFSALVRRVQGGETFIITVRGREAAQLCPVVPRIEAKEGTT